LHHSIEIKLVFARERNSAIMRANLQLGSYFLMPT